MVNVVESDDRSLSRFESSCDSVEAEVILLEDLVRRRSGIHRRFGIADHVRTGARPESQVDHR